MLPRVGATPDLIGLVIAIHRLVHQLPQFSGRFADGHVWVDRVEVQQFDAVGAQASETFVALFENYLRSGVASLSTFVVVVNAAFGGQDKLGTS